MSVMFANARNPPGNNSGILLDFKAGRVTMDTGSSSKMRKCIPQSTKGSIYIMQSNDQLLHFCWRNRENNKTDLDLIIFPGDTEFVKVKECSDGRVYMLKFKSNSTRFCFWMQDASSAKDAEICDKMNELLSVPPTARNNRSNTVGAERGASTSANALGNMASLNNVLGTGGDEIGALGSMDQGQIMQLLSLMNGSVPSDGYMPSLGYNAKSESSQDTPVNRSRAQKLGNSANNNNNNATPIVDSQTLSAILNAIPTDTPSGSANHMPQIDFTEMFSRANVQETVMANAERLIPHLPEQSEDVQSKRENELEQTVGNPQFRQAAEFFGHAFQTGSLADALSHFGIKEGAVEKARVGDVLGFAKKLTEQEQRNSEKRASPSDANVDDPFDESGRVHETNEFAASGDPPKAKRGKTDDNMELD